MRCFRSLGPLLFDCITCIFVVGVFISSFSFWFDFVECEIIIKFVGVYSVCSELYNLHELLGERFCTAHTRKKIQASLQLMLVRNVCVVTDDVRQMCYCVFFLSLSLSRFHVRKDMLFFLYACVCLKNELGLESYNAVNAIRSDIRQINIYFFLKLHLLLFMFVSFGHLLLYTIQLFVFILVLIFSLNLVQWRFNWFCRQLRYIFFIFIKFHTKCKSRSMEQT